MFPQWNKLVIDGLKLEGPAWSWLVLWIDPSPSTTLTPSPYQQHFRQSFDPDIYDHVAQHGSQPETSSSRMWEGERRPASPNAKWHASERWNTQLA